MKHTIKLLSLAFTLAAILTLTGCPGPVVPDVPCTHEHTKTEVIEEATCTEDGLGKIVCLDCEYEEIKTILAHHHVDYETSGYCETCTEYKFEYPFTVRVFTSIDEWYKVHPRINQMSTMQKSEPSYEECNFSFETNSDSFSIGLNKLIHLKDKYNGYKVHKFFDESNVLDYTETMEEEGVFIFTIMNMDILLSQN